MRLGIDFGTTHTVVAWIDRGNYPIVSFEDGDAIPSIISLDPAGALSFGRTEAGWPQLRSFKRLLDGARPDTEVMLGGRPFLLAELLAQFLGHVREQLLGHSNAAAGATGPLEAAVSVPANASTAQRLMTIDAFRRAGFDVKAVLNEPSAAGFEYAHRFRETLNSKREYVLVYDLGGGTFDASLIRMVERSNEVVSSHGVSRLGGDDFDEVIANLVRARQSGELSDALLDTVRAQKEGLGPNSRKLIVPLEDSPVVLPIDEVYAACAPLVEQTLTAMAPAMCDPGRPDDPVPWSELAGIYVVGGASAFPPVYRRLRERFGAHRVRRSPHPYGSCAIGLAIFLDEESGYHLTDRLSRHFGVFREAGGIGEVSFDVLVPKDTALPTEVTRRYRAAHNVGHYRYVECARIDDGQPGGNLATWDDFRFPFDPVLRTVDLGEVPITRLPASGPVVEESYRCHADGTVEAMVRVVDDGYTRSVRLARR